MNLADAGDGGKQANKGKNSPSLELGIYSGQHELTPLSPTDPLTLQKTLMDFGELCNIDFIVLFFAQAVNRPTF